ncbi:MAG: lantibiotic dehydratase family protein [Dysgonamonadaceae bacterium]|jgi:hypothetical protein|nr:lantibiotic dehydratase family protein [Dysgonamonadaceae bacterium]
MYNPFDRFFVRTSCFPFNSLKEEIFRTKILNPQVQEAIYIASPVLYAELQKYIAGTIINIEEKQRIESAVYRYISRMSSRCTPFGLFAGCSLGEITGDETNILLDNFKRHTRLDMYFLCILSQELSKQSGIKENIKYFPNTTLHSIGNKYRYVEYHYKQSKRIHRISSVSRSPYLDTILKIARKGTKINNLLTYLINSKITEDKTEALDFIYELIDSQIIINELSPSVTGDDFFSRIISILEKSDVEENLIMPLKEIQKTLWQLDSNQNNDVELYQNIIRKIEEIKIPYEEKFLFQVDMTKNVIEATLGKDIINELQSTMIFLNKITSEQKNETLVQFQQAFYNRYEDKEVPLMEVLDIEMGIGYPVSANTGDVSPLLDDFLIFGQTGQGMNFQSNAFLSILFKKTIEALSQNKNEIIFNDDDVKNFNIYWEDLPHTIYSKFEIIRSNKESPLIQLNGFYGNCGANLLARFAHTDEKVTRFVSQVVAKEQQLEPNALLAEIAHLPDSRTGNVLSRPHIRDYEILYLANSDLPEKKLIYMSDLCISIRKGRIYLRSKRLNKEIIPRLTNAHNYRNNPMPVYHFLCDMQMQQGRGGLFFNWRYLNNELSFLPRVRYKNTILSLATWKIKIEEIKHLFAIKEDDKLITEVRKWREQYHFPEKMILPDGDNELLIDWENVRSIKALFSIIKKREMIILTEFLYDPENSVVRNKNGNPYPNECIVAFYKTPKK